MMAQLARMRS